MNQDSTHPQDSPACDQCRRIVLDLAMLAETRDQTAQALAHLQSCDECRVAVEEFDQIGELLAPGAGSTHMENHLEGHADSHTESHIAAGSARWADRAIQTMPFQNRSPIRWFVAARLAIAASISLILLFAGYIVGHHARPVDFTSDSSALVSAIAPAEISNRVRAFQEVSRAFDNRASWMLVSDSASDVGLDPQPLAQTSTSTGMLLLRLTVTQRSNAVSGFGNSTRTGVVVSSADLAILPGRTARLSLPFSQGRTLAYEITTSEGDPTQLGLIAELLPENHTESRADGRTGSHFESLSERASEKPLATLSTMMEVQPNRAFAVGSFVAANSDYELAVTFCKARLSSEPRP